MANTHSAQKRNRQSLKRRARNTSVNSAVKTAVKKAREAITTGDKAKAKEALSFATRELSRAATKGVLHANNARRRIARLAHAFTAKLTGTAK